MESYFHGINPRRQPLWYWKNNPSTLTTHPRFYPPGKGNPIEIKEEKTEKRKLGKRGRNREKI
jgi:hypothetical protein